MEAEKPLTKIQHDFMIKILDNIDVKGTHFNIINTIYPQPTNFLQKQENKKTIQKFIWNHKQPQISKQS